MAKWSFQVPTWTPANTADGTAIANNSYMAIQGGSATQSILVIELMIGGQSTSSNALYMQFARDSTLASAPSAIAAPVSNGPMNTATAPLAAAQTVYVAATTGPQRSNSTSLARLNLSFNAFGGIVRWVAAPGEEWQILGNAATAGESTLSNYAGGANGAAISAHIVYEPY
jgi:hypothetical protein